MLLGMFFYHIAPISLYTYDNNRAVVFESPFNARYISIKFSSTYMLSCDLMCSLIKVLVNYSVTTYPHSLDVAFVKHAIRRSVLHFVSGSIRQECVVIQVK